MATNTHERKAYAIAIAAATGKRILWEEDKDGKRWRGIVCDKCDGAGFYRGRPCDTCNTRGWTQHQVGPTKASQFQVR